MFSSVEEMCRAAEAAREPLWKVIQENECKERGISKEQSFGEMLYIYHAMRDSLNRYDGRMAAGSGLVGNLGEKFERRRREGRLLCGEFMGNVVEKALKISESNACMRRIAACPTAGSCGVVPGVLLSFQEQAGCTDEDMAKALYVAAGIGGVIARRAFLSGAAGGCQAEVGSASAMAAGGLACLMGGSARQSAAAAAIALKGLLGLVCDPVAGLVQVPCVKRNVTGAVNAVAAAELAMAGIESAIPADEVIDAMREIGRRMSPELKETGIGGLAGTATGIRIRESLFPSPKASGPPAQP